MKKRRLSPFRVFIALIILVGIVYGCSRGFNSFKEATMTNNLKPWFGAYVDVTATPLFPFEQLGSEEGQKNLVLSFIVSSSNDACIATWGNAYTLEEANAKLDLDRRIARFRQEGGNIAISFGGLLNHELAVNCTDEDKLQKTYLEIINRYTIDTLDFDIEGESLKNVESLQRRASVVTKLQQKLKNDNKHLAVWMTLPISTQGLTEDGANAVTQMLRYGVDLSGINGMTMNYGNSKEKNHSVKQASEKALQELHRQMGIIFRKEGINLNEASLWAKIGATPMIGQNDIAEEIFSLEDAQGFNDFVISKRIARLSMWSANRDIQCGENYVNTSVVSDSCSGIKQDKYKFSMLLGKNFLGNISDNAVLTTKEDPIVEQKPDNPEESPYQIWSQSGTYLEGTKVVWHQNVYQAKWWTQGDLPDNPVLQSWQTPWQLVGPVLPGEKPIAQPMLPPGTYPVWTGSDTYDAGQRVLLNGIPYQAKWWTQGDSPAASAANPDSSPWKALTQEQVNDILENN